MRLTDHQLKEIKTAFAAYFFWGDTLWLFGSRTDDAQKGGDIDLYIETTCNDTMLAEEKKLKFLVLLQRSLGEQKIDVVLNILTRKKTLPIYEEAQKNGILLMKKQTLLASYIRCLDIHARRLGTALARVEPMLPMTADKIHSISDEQASFLEVVNNRFGKMQDEIGGKVFPTVAELANKKARTFIDVLNVMEKIELLDNSSWFESLRDLRNAITHDYEEDYETLARHTNQLIPKAHQILAYWKDLKPKLEPFLQVAEDSDSQAT